MSRQEPVRERREHRSSDQLSVISTFIARDRTRDAIRASLCAILMEGGISRPFDPVRFRTGFAEAVDSGGRVISSVVFFYRAGVREASPSRGGFEVKPRAIENSLQYRGISGSISIAHRSIPPAMDRTSSKPN